MKFDPFRSSSELNSEELGGEKEEEGASTTPTPTSIIIFYLHGFDQLFFSKAAECRGHSCRVYVVPMQGAKRKKGRNIALTT